MQRIEHLQTRSRRYAEPRAGGSPRGFVPCLIDDLLRRRTRALAWPPARGGPAASCSAGAVVDVDAGRA